MRSRRSETVSSSILHHSAFKHFIPEPYGAALRFCSYSKWLLSHNGYKFYEVTELLFLYFLRASHAQMSTFNAKISREKRGAGRTVNRTFGPTHISVSPGKGSWTGAGAGVRLSEGSLVPWHPLWVSSHIFCLIGCRISGLRELRQSPLLLSFYLSFFLSFVLSQFSNIVVVFLLYIHSLYFSFLFIYLLFYFNIFQIF